MDPEGLANCLIAMNGIANVTVQLGNIEFEDNAKSKAKNLNIDKITFFNQFVFEKSGIRVYRQASIGNGHLIPIKKPVATLTKYNCSYYYPKSRKPNTLIEVIRVHKICAPIILNPTLLS